MVYDINTANETWEWVDLKEVILKCIDVVVCNMIPVLQGRYLYDLQIPQRDIRWEGEENGVTLHAGHGGGLGRVPMTQTRRDHLIAQNGGGRRFFDEIELFNTDSLVKEVRISLSLHYVDNFFTYCL